MRKNSHSTGKLLKQKIQINITAGVVHYYDIARKISQVCTWVLLLFTCKCEIGFKWHMSNYNKPNFLTRFLYIGLNVAFAMIFKQTKVI